MKKKCILQNIFTKFAPESSYLPQKIEVEITRVHLGFKKNIHLSELQFNATNFSDFEPDIIDAFYQMHIELLWFEILHPLRNDFTQNRWQDHLRMILDSLVSYSKNDSELDYRLIIHEMAFWGYFEVGNWGEASLNGLFLDNQINSGEKLVVLSDHLFRDSYFAATWRGFLNGTQPPNNNLGNIQPWHEVRKWQHWPIEWLISLGEETSQSVILNQKRLEIDKLKALSSHLGELPSFLKDEWNQLLLHSSAKK